LSRVGTIDLGPLESQLNDVELKNAFLLWQEGNLTKLFDATDLDLATWATLARALLFYKLGTEETQVTIILGQKQLQNFAEMLNPDDLKNFLKQIQHVSQLLKFNVNRKLALENLFLKLPRPGKKE
jgi:hypothetical protein